MTNMKKNWFKIAGLAFLALNIASLGVVAYAEDDAGSTPAGWSQGKKTGWDSGSHPPGWAKREARKGEIKLKEATGEAGKAARETKVKNAQEKTAKEAKRAEEKARKDAEKLKAKSEKEAKKAQKKAEKEAKKLQKENDEARKRAEKQVRKQERESLKKAEELTGKSSRQAKGFAGF